MSRPAGNGSSATSTAMAPSAVACLKAGSLMTWSNCASIVSPGHASSSPAGLEVKVSPDSGICTLSRGAPRRQQSGTFSHYHDEPGSGEPYAAHARV